jgi:hypothetical protein
MGRPLQDACPDDHHQAGPVRSHRIVPERTRAIRSGKLERWHPHNWGHASARGAHPLVNLATNDTEGPPDLPYFVGVCRIGVWLRTWR